MDGINPSAIVQKVELSEESLRIQVPCSMSISGPSQSNFVTQKYILLKNFKVRQIGNIAESPLLRKIQILLTKPNRINFSLTKLQVENQNLLFN